jgi:NAD(P)-dependent dehydrogenase (short-subunit alcohol dehydrogenase family)
MATLAGQRIVVIGGSAGIGLETARQARADGAEVILTGRDRERLDAAAREVDAQGVVAFDAADSGALARFFRDAPTPIDHVMVTAGVPHYIPPLEIAPEEARTAFADKLALTLQIAQESVGKVRPGGSLVFVGGTGGRRPRRGYALIGTVTTALPALIANLALDLAPTRINLIAPGFVDTPLSARLLGDDIDKRREELRATLPIGRVVGPEDVAALALHLMTNTALTGATYDIDGGQQLLTT